ESGAHVRSLGIRLQPALRCFRIFAAVVQPEERRTGPGQRGKDSCLRRAFARKNTLDCAQGGILRKDDSFKVVLNPAIYPGADKRGLLGSGEVLSHGEDTGGAGLLAIFGKRSSEGAGIDTAQLT